MLLAANVTLFRLTFTKTATFLEKGMTRSFIMTVPIITLRSNRKTGIKNTVKVRNTGLTPSYRWDCLPMETVYLLLSLYSQEIRMNRSLLKPLEQKVINDFGCKRFIFCSDAGLASENNRILNDAKDRAFIVTQSIKKLSAEFKELALNRQRFRRLSDNKLVDLDDITSDDYDQLILQRGTL